ncbi:MAG: helix-turn-helix domain-containing protein [Fidelibacterota bacterium]
MGKNIYIKNMVCDRCIRVVKEEFENLGLVVDNIKLGQVTIANPESIKDIQTIEKMLLKNGFEILKDSKAQTIENIKTEIIKLIQSDEMEELNINVSDYISEKVGRDYPYLSHLFSSVESITIEKYFILQRIERVKELLVYNELSLTEIAYKLGYSNVQYLSNQFKKITGLSPSHFKQLKRNQRKTLDNVITQQ